eukprot:gene918-545_t
MTSCTFSGARLAALLDDFNAAVSRGDPTAVKIGALGFVFGELSESTLENQRGQAVIQYLLESKSPVCNVFLLVTASSAVIYHHPSLQLKVPILENFTITAVADYSQWVTAAQHLLEGKDIGVAMKELELQEGHFITEAINHVKQRFQHVLVEAAPLLGELLFKKDENAQKSVEKAALLCGMLFRRYICELLKSQLFKSNPKSLASLREEICDKLMHPNSISGMEALNAEEFSMAAALPACVFQKGAYESKIQVSTERLQELCSETLNDDIIIVRYGIKHFGFTSFFGRTLLVESKAPPNAKTSYEFAYAVSEQVIQNLKIGAALKDVYENSMKYAAATNAELSVHLLKSFGFSTGLLVLEPRGTISEKGGATISEGMCFVVRVVLENIDGGDGKTFNIELADTVIIRNGVAELRTKSFRAVEDVLFDVEEESSVPAPRDLTKITRHGVTGTMTGSRAAEREQQLKRLLVELQAEYIAAGGKKGSKASSEDLSVYEIGKLALGELQLLGHNDPEPLEAKNGIFVAPSKRIAWFPVYGKPCPFHIATINKVEMKREGDNYVFIVTFHTLQESNIGFRLNRTKCFLKELTYTAKKDIFTEYQIAIQTVQQAIKNDDAHRKKTATTASSGKLHTVGDPIRLPQIKMRPALQIGRKNQALTGNLELHQNGLRFSYLGGTPIDFLFENIKHIIFQPAVNSVLVCYHITLKKSVDLGRRAANEVQFMAEVMESSEAVSGARRSHEEEMAAEEREEARVRETNKQFFNFARAVDSKSTIRTQIPINDFTFDGVHSKAMVAFRGSRDVLWAVADWPPFTISVSEIEVASLERVVATNSTFDLTFIMKDYNKPVVTINSIPMSSLDPIKDWCLGARLYYMETEINPNWKLILKQIRDDDEWEPWSMEEGWRTLNNDDDEEESESDTDSTYTEDEETESSEDSSWLEDEESDISSGAESDATSSADWDELDRRAQEQDRKRNYDDDDNERPRKRARTTHANNAPPPLFSWITKRNINGISQRYYRETRILSCFNSSLFASLRDVQLQIKGFNIIFLYPCIPVCICFIFLAKPIPSSNARLCVGCVGCGWLLCVMDGEVSVGVFAFILSTPRPSNTVSFLPAFLTNAANASYFGIKMPNVSHPELSFNSREYKPDFSALVSVVNDLVDVWDILLCLAIRQPRHLEVFDEDKP